MSKVAKLRTVTKEVRIPEIHKSQIVLFCHAHRSNAWLKYGPMRCYLRVGERYIEGKRLRVLDIATLSIDNPKFLNRGVFTSFIEWIPTVAEEAGCYGLYVENVMTPRFADWFRRRNWLDMLAIAEPCFYWKLRPSEDVEMEE